MSHSSHIFADRIVNLAVTGPLIRIELAAMTPPAAEGEKPELRPTQILVMPIDGFMASFGMLEVVVKKMVADGMLKPKQPEPAPSPETPSTRQRSGRK